MIVYNWILKQATQASIIIIFKLRSKYRRLSHVDEKRINVNFRRKKKKIEEITIEIQQNQIDFSPFFLLCYKLQNK